MGEEWAAGNGSFGNDALIEEFLGKVTPISQGRRRHGVEVPLSDAEIRKLRSLLTLSDRIESMVANGEALVHRCPTARRVLGDMGRDGEG